MHRYFQFTLTGLTATALFLACRESTTPRETAQRTDAGLSNTAASSFASTLLARGNAGTFHIQSKANGFDVEIKAKDNTDIAVANIVVAPLGHSGWHSHPGPVLVVVTKGAITFYEGDDPTCSPTVHHVGSAFIEVGGHVGIARNESTTEEAKVTATFFAPPIPPGSPSNLRIDQPRPGNCPF